MNSYEYMLPSDMNLRIGKVKNYNNKILISSPSFNIGTNLKELCHLPDWLVSFNHS